MFDQLFEDKEKPSLKSLIDALIIQVEKQSSPMSKEEKHNFTRAFFLGFHSYGETAKKMSVEMGGMAAAMFLEMVGMEATLFLCKDSIDWSKKDGECTSEGIPPVENPEGCGSSERPRPDMSKNRFANGNYFKMNSVNDKSIEDVLSDIEKEMNSDYKGKEVLNSKGLYVVICGKGHGFKIGEKVHLIGELKECGEFYSDGKRQTLQSDQVELFVDMNESDLN